MAITGDCILKNLHLQVCWGSLQGDLQRNWGNGLFVHVCCLFSYVVLRKVAIKVISLGGDIKIHDIRNEVMMMKLSSHENVVKHHGTYLKNEKLWVSMNAYCTRGEIIYCHISGCDGIYGRWRSY